MLKLTNQKGFTIVELLVVIVVIAILVALTLPNLFSLQQRARDDQRKNDIKNIQQQLEAYFNDNNAYPAATADLVGDYLDAVPEDPQGGAYTYAAVAAGGGACTTAADDCETYTLSATLENENDPADADDGTDDGLYTVESVNQ